jgi:hypothetical protein
MSLRFGSSLKRDFALLALLVCFCCQAQTPPQNPDELTKLVNSVITWDERLNSDGTCLEPHLMTTQARNGINYGAYDFYLKGAPADHTYTMFQWQLGQAQPERVMAAYVSNNGRLCMNAIDCHDTSGPYVLLALAAPPGLPHRLGIASEDKKYKAAVLIVPTPVVGEDKGCRVEVIRAREDFSFAVIRGKRLSTQRRNSLRLEFCRRESKRVL